MLDKLKVFFIKNWKTSIGGILALIVTLLVQAEVISAEIGTMFTGLLVGLGFIASKDANKTGT